jgi:hypothetical protein
MSDFGGRFVCGLGDGVLTVARSALVVVVVAPLSLLFVIQEESLRSVNDKNATQRFLLNDKQKRQREATTKGNNESQSGEYYL